MLWQLWSGIEVVITGLTRNQLYLMVPWVRIPPSAPAAGCRTQSAPTFMWGRFLCPEQKNLFSNDTTDELKQKTRTTSTNGVMVWVFRCSELAKFIHNWLKTITKPILQPMVQHEKSLTS